MIPFEYEMREESNYNTNNNDIFDLKESLHKFVIRNMCTLEYPAQTQTKTQTGRKINSFFVHPFLCGRRGWP